MAEVSIVRTDVIVVNTIGKDTYGNLTFTDKAGNEYKVGAKRIQYFEKIIVPGMAVQLSYAMSSFGKEYIYSAKLVSEKLAETSPEAPQDKTGAVEKKTPQEVSKPKAMPSKDPKSRAFGLSYSKDLAMQKVITVDKILAYAETFRMYLDGEITLENPVAFQDTIMRYFKRIGDPGGEDKKDKGG